MLMKTTGSEESLPPDDPGGYGGAVDGWAGSDDWAGPDGVSLDDWAGLDDWVGLDDRVDVQIVADYELQRWADIEHEEPADPEAVPVPPDRFATE
ncbi:hypothetical protein D6T64_16880, partial [Cryobacterium melibiosiphilum]